MNRVSWKRAADLEPGDVIDSPTSASSMPRTVVESVEPATPPNRHVVVRHRHVGDHADQGWTAYLDPEQAVIVYLPPAASRRRS